ncbi:MAG: CDP-archaeol synthase [Desulfurococcaceae archaeon]
MSIEKYALWFLKYYVPVMVANGFPVLVKGTHRIDRDLDFLDKKPIFGRNKTIEGFIFGLIGAYIAASSISIVFLDLALVPLLTGVGLFALLGDLVGAFVKRRLGIKPGSPAPILDQLDFLLMSTLFYYLAGVEEVVNNAHYVVITLLFIAGLHVFTNYIAYTLGLKQTKL